MEEETKHWTARRKSALVLEIIQGQPPIAYASLIQGRPWNHKRIYWVYKRMNLQPRRSAKKRLPRAAAGAALRTHPPGYRLVRRLHVRPKGVLPAFRTFNVVDDFSRDAMHIDGDTWITSERLIRIFKWLQAESGLPPAMSTDDGPEFLGEALTNWGKQAGG